MEYIKVKAVSPFGFLIEGRDDWFKCDRYFLKKASFTNLKKGDLISKMEFNGNGFVKSLTFLSSREDAGEPNSSPLLKANENNSPAYVPLGSSAPEPNSVKVNSPKSDLARDRIMYGQAVNIAFQSLSSRDLSLEASCNIIKGFNIADFIYDEYVRRCSR